MLIVDYIKIQYDEAIDFLTNGQTKEYLLKYSDKKKVERSTKEVWACIVFLVVVSLFAAPFTHSLILIIMLVGFGIYLEYDKKLEIEKFKKHTPEEFEIIFNTRKLSIAANLEKLCFTQYSLSDSEAKMVKLWSDKIYKLTYNIYDRHDTVLVELKIESKEMSALKLDDLINRT